MDFFTLCFFSLYFHSYFIFFQKIEQSFEKTPILHAVFNMKELEEVEHKSYFVYFIRKSLLPISTMESLEDAMTDMPDHFIMGTFRGSFLHKLLYLSKNILRNLFTLQMRVPSINDKNDAMEATDEGEQKIGLIDFSRPSDYRMKAIEAKNSGINIGDDTSHLSGTSRLSTVATSIESLKTGNTPYEGKMSIKLVILFAFSSFISFSIQFIRAHIHSLDFLN